METWTANSVAKVRTGSIKEANEEEEVSRSFWATRIRTIKPLGITSKCKAQV
jgi:hypothetical protein